MQPEKEERIVIVDGGGLSYRGLMSDRHDIYLHANNEDKIDPFPLYNTDYQGPRGSSRKSEAHARAKRKQQRASRKRNRK